MAVTYVASAPCPNYYSELFILELASYSGAKLDSYAALLLIKAKY